MRALHVVAGNLYGGVERIVVEIASGPAAWQHEFALCFEGRLREELEERSATCHMLGEVRFSRPTTVWRARRRLSAICGASIFDAIVCHSPWTFALAAPACAGFRRILWAHNALDGTHWTERRVRRTPPDLVICNSEYTSNVVSAWMHATPRVVVYAPIAPDRTIPGVRDDVRRGLGVNDGTTVILMASRLEKSKGHEALVEAASVLLGDWSIWVAGGAQQESEEHLARELRDIIRARGLENRVRLLGERRDVPRLLRGADIFCQPNLRAEPFGVAFVEALYAGVPVVTTNLGGAREIITADCGVLLPAGDVPALRAALQRLVDDPERRLELGSAGPARARTISDPRVQIGRLERVLAPQPDVAWAQS
jgi:glycosyltransferase involved in cell wall biosynthesis